MITSMKKQVRNMSRAVNWSMTLIVCWLLMITYANLNARLERIEMQTSIQTLEQIQELQDYVEAIAAPLEE